MTTTRMTDTSNTTLPSFTVQVEGVEPLTFDLNKQILLPMPPPGWLWEELPLFYQGTVRKQYQLIRDNTVEKAQNPPWWFPGTKHDFDNRELLVIDPRLWIEASRVMKEYCLAHAKDKEAERKRNEQAIATMRAAYEERQEFFASEEAKLKVLREEREELHRKKAAMWSYPIVHHEDEPAT